MEPRVFEHCATPARLPGVFVAPTTLTLEHGASVRRIDYFVVHRAVACQIPEVRVLEESGVSPHHLVQVKLKRADYESAGHAKNSATPSHHWLHGRTALLRA